MLFIILSYYIEYHSSAWLAKVGRFFLPKKWKCFYLSPLYFSQLKLQKMLGGIFNAIAGSASAGKQKKMIEAEERKNNQWFDRRYNEDMTQRADAQRYLTQMRDAIREANAQNAAMAAVSGASEEAKANSKAAEMATLGNTMATLAVQGEARKDNIEQQYRERDQQIFDKKLGNEQQRMNAIAQAGQAFDNTLNTAITAAGNMMHI